jgi:hypothetical protein
MTVITSQHPAPSGSGRDAIYQRLAHLHRNELKPIGPIENTLVETIIHNAFQLHAAQAAEREASLSNPSGLVNLNRLARYRATLQRTTRDALAQLRDLQRHRLAPEPKVMTAAAHTDLDAQAATGRAGAGRSGFGSASAAALAAAQPGPAIPFPIDRPAQPRASSSDPNPEPSSAPSSPLPPRLNPCDIASPSCNPTAAQLKPSRQTP